MDLALGAWINKKKINKQTAFEKYLGKVFDTWETWKTFLHIDNIIMFHVINDYIFLWNLLFNFST